jgi:hypothetical protein
MSGGGRLVVFNTRERAVSSDQNRHQAFAALERAEALRYQIALRQAPLADELNPLELGAYVDTTAAGGAAIASPIVADVLDGLTVRPQPSSLNLAVDPGVIGLVDPDGETGSSDPGSPSSDDSRYKVVVDPGIQTLGALVITAGAGSTRVDLVEVRRQTVVLETDSRDVFDPSTGVFVPVTVTKVQEGRLLYRVRAGTPGAGIPALAQGWVPLCVAVVPSGATNVDGMTFYDVRPLVKDRVNAPFESRRLASSLDQARLYANDHTTGGVTLVTGIATGAIGMYRAGGILSGANAVDVRLPANQMSGYSPTVGKPWFLYAMFPASLPRWVRYAAFPNPRAPNGPNGIIGISDLGPTNQFGGAPTLTPPAASGLAVTGPAIMLAAGVVSAGPAERGFNQQNGLVLVNPDAPISGPAVTAAASTDTYALVANTHFPRTARSVIVKVSATFSGAGAGAFDQIHTTITLRPSATSDRVANAWDANLPVVYSGGGGGSVAFRFELPVIAFATLNGEPDDGVTFIVEWSTVTTRSLQGASILGWRL